MAAPPALTWADAPPYHYHGTPLPLPKTSPPEEAAAPDEPRSLYIRGLLPWMNEDYLYSCFTRVPELLSVVIWRSKHTGQSDGFGFLNFADHSTAGHVLHSYNGQKMPNADRHFRLQWRTRTQQPPPESHHFNLNWVTQQQQDPPQGHIDDNSDDYAIFVGDLAFDVTPFMLQHLFKTRYPSVKSAKIIYDKETGHSKGYGFVAFGDANEHSQAMTEMNGAYCSTRPMRIGPAPNKRVRPIGTQGTDFHHQDPNTSRLFVGSLDQSVTSEDLRQAFIPYGELVYAKVLEGKHCGFVTYSSRASAEKAILMLNESQLGGSTIQVSFARPLAKKQDQLNVGHHGRPQSYGPGSGWFSQDPYACAHTGLPGYGSFQQQQPQVQ